MHRYRTDHMDARMASGGRSRSVILIAVLLAALLGMVVVCDVLSSQHAEDSRYRSLVAEQQLLTKQIAALAAQFADGSSDSFETLGLLGVAFDRNLQPLRAGAPQGHEAAERLAETQRLWRGYQENARVISEGGPALIELREIVEAINTDAPRMLALADQITTQMASNGARADQVYISARQLMLAQRIINNLNRVLAGGEGAVVAADRFGRDAALFGRVLNGLRHGDSTLGIQRVNEVEIVARLEEQAVLFETLARQVGGVLERTPEAFRIAEAAQDILNQSDNLFEALAALDRAYQSEVDSRGVTSLFGKIFAAQAAL